MCSLMWSWQQTLKEVLVFCFVVALGVYFFCTRLWLGAMTAMMRHLFVQIITLQPLCLMGFGGVCQAGLQPLVHISQGLDLHVHTQSVKLQLPVSPHTKCVHTQGAYLHAHILRDAAAVTVCKCASR